MKGRPKSIQFRRKREGKTNYKKRLRLILSGRPRLVVRPTSTGILSQVIITGDKGDNVMASAHSSELRKIGWNYNLANLPSAYLTGMLVAKKALQNKIKDAILDIGMTVPVKGARVFACLKGAVDAGLEVPFSEDVLPSIERIKGDHIVKYAEMMKKSGKYEKVFSEHVKKKADVKDLPKAFEEIKNKILKK